MEMRALFTMAGFYGSSTYNPHVFSMTTMGLHDRRPTVDLKKKMEEMEMKHSNQLLALMESNASYTSILRQRIRELEEQIVRLSTPKPSAPAPELKAAAPELTASALEIKPTAPELTASALEIKPSAPKIKADAKACVGDDADAKAVVTLPIINPIHAPAVPVASAYASSAMTELRD